MIGQSVTDRIEQIKSKNNVIDIIFCDDMLDVDLYIKIKSLYKDSFKPQDRIIFVITKDYHDGDRPGLLLQKIQTMVNDVDISNFFITVVTTNPDIEKHYKTVLDTSSIDQVPFNVEFCKGPYKNIPSKQNITQKKYYDINSQIKEIENLSAEQKELLFNSDGFCLMPWIGIHIGPDSIVSPCCSSTLEMGDASKRSLDEIWNSPPITSLRKQMLSGERPLSCQHCYLRESLGRHSLRQTTNEKFASSISKVNKTSDDGYFSLFELKYWDIRYNNLCNLACRTCNPISSSAWHKPALYLGYKDLPKGALRIAGKNDKNIFDQMLHHIDFVESIYFAGGEPLMIEEFYILLEKLLERGRNHVRLLYNTNLTRITLKSKNIFDLWKEFPNVSVGASLDGEYQRGEYLREGTKWDDVIDNRRRMIEKCPHIDFYITATTNMLNALHIPDFHKSWVELKLIEPSDFNIQLLFQPEWMCINRAPAELKQQIRQRYAEHLNWLEPKDNLGRATYGFRSLLEQMNTDIEFDAVKFWNQIDSLDRFYNKNLLNIFPELSTLPRN